MARGINNMEGEIVTALKQIKIKSTPPFESAANGGVEILCRSNLMSSQKSVGRGQILQITEFQVRQPCHFIRKWNRIRKAFEARK
ncbi:MAG TPA: hypothetical protein VHC44_00530 [Verrucomicrobiae bacterium]|nr:hypothetical protein [Verrucomicrobiae bacterium]